MWVLLFYLFLNHFSKIDFAVEVIKEGNSLHVVNLSVDTRFVKYYRFSSHYHKQWPINNIKVKCLQIGQNMSDIFWTCSLESLWQIESIADFIILVLLITTMIFTNEWESIDLYTFECLEILWFIQTCHLANFVKVYLNIYFLLLSIILIPYPGKNISRSQKHVLKAQIAWNQNLSPNPKGLQSPLLKFKFTSLDLFFFCVVRNNLLQYKIVAILQ